MIYNESKAFLMHHFLLFLAYIKATILIYPKTKKEDTKDTYFNTIINDPYQWLENDKSEATALWVNKQNETTQAYLNNIPFKNKIKERLTKLWNYEKIGAPYKRGEYTYYSKNNGLQNQNVIYRTKNDKTTVFIDPNKLSKDGTTSLDALSFTKNGELLAYSISKGGSDWREIIVVNTKEPAITLERIKDVKFSNISWYKNEGFYYSSYDKPLGSKLSAKTESHKVYYHKLGTEQADDILIFGGKTDEKHRYISASVTEDYTYLVITARNSTSGNKLYIKNLSKPKHNFTTLLNHTETDTYVLDNQGSKLYLVTNLNAPNKKIVTVDATNPKPEYWIDFIPETTQVLNASSGGGYFFANYMIDAVSLVKQYNYNGKLIKEIKLPGLGTATGFSALKTDTEVYYSFTNYITPSSLFKLDLKTENTALYWAPKIDFNTNKYQSKQVFYTSKDGTKIPMMITHKKTVKLNGKNPTILYGYGGFNVSLTPAFSITNLVWMEQGGILAVPNIRGGGEYGKTWHDAGTKLNKQNVFDDFIAAAEFLISKQYTNSNYLALRGGSNGGLLVGATITQRPKLAKVALPAVGVLDMLRYHKFTAGAGWAYDYGTANQNETMFNYLKAYSPVHNVKPNTAYPATLITTGDHDDRVVPAHSYKFAAQLQDKQTGNNPTLIRIETNAGHGAGTPINKTIEQYADIFGFTLFNMGFKTLPETH